MVIEQDSTGLKNTSVIKREPNQIKGYIFSFLFNGPKILQISGNAGIGKSTITQWIIGNIIAKKLSCALWITAGKNFSLKRLCDLFRNNNQKLKYIKANIFVSHVSSYFMQQLRIDAICSKEYEGLPRVQFLVFDSISHHFRHRLNETSDAKQKIRLIDNFFEEQILPLQMFAIRINAFLVFIHEVSYSPKLSKNVKFLQKMFDRIDSTMINLETDEMGEKSIEIQYHKNKLNYNYEILTNKIRFYK